MRTASRSFLVCNRNSCSCTMGHGAALCSYHFGRCYSTKTLSWCVEVVSKQLFSSTSSRHQASESFFSRFHLVTWSMGALYSLHFTTVFVLHLIHFNNRIMDYSFSIKFQIKAIMIQWNVIYTSIEIRVQMTKNKRISQTVFMQLQLLLISETNCGDYSI